MQFLGIDFTDTSQNMLSFPSSKSWNFRVSESAAPSKKSAKTFVSKAENRNTDVGSV